MSDTHLLLVCCVWLGGFVTSVPVSTITSASSMPTSLVRSYGQFQRWATDKVTRRERLFASHSYQTEYFESRMVLRQRIMRTDSFEAKVHNISRAFDKVNDVVIQPGQIFSFWYLVGEPSEGNGYKQSRSLLNGKLVQDYGGGLCQLAGIIYYLSLLAGLKTIERHPHSRDIYREDERFAPLGSDASVAYGVKDLRIQNSLVFPVQFRLDIEGEQLVGRLCSLHTVSQSQIEFVRHDDAGSTRFVETFVVSSKSGRKRISSSTYKIGAT